LAREVKGKSVLNIGCGPQFYDDVQFFNEVPEKYVGIDVNKNNIRFLKESNHPEVLKWRKFLKMHGVTVGLKRVSIKEKQNEFVDQFDGIYAVGVLGMFSKKETENIFGFLSSYLKKGGILVDVDWTKPHLSEEKLRERKSYEWYSKNELSVEEIGNILKKNGFEIVRYGVYIVPNPKEYLWGKIYGYVGRKL